MLIRITFCEFCDKLKFPQELIKWSGECSKCKKDTARIALFDTDDGIRALLDKEKVK